MSEHNIMPEWVEGWMPWIVAFGTALIGWRIGSAKNQATQETKISKMENEIKTISGDFASFRDDEHKVSVENAKSLASMKTSLNHFSDDLNRNTNATDELRVRILKLEAGQGAATTKGD